ncbi:sodium/hydrogen exchanger [Thermaerobacter marianensis DSM 12885]|uniref:Sodium/hydrogen exchanger n=1 Tax=Thermaerobacter marianensis (strain ATCC 700841 / DSM 12885 / JCM 10246 / 7p75a) TaxID=644966 RepID=E6SK80_THEM7|nr:sodium/hydrogen exchanger [Thermaerobacter marianensis DSM 12885]
MGVALLLGVALTWLADRVALPALVLFLGLGMLVGSDGLGWIDFDNARLAQQVGTVALALILFEGGLASRWAELRPVLAPGLALATAGVAISAAVVGGVAALLPGLDLAHGLLIGAIVGSTDAAAVFAILRRTPLPRKLAATLELESGTNDPVAIFLTDLFVRMVIEPVTPLEGAELLLRQLGFGAVAGWVAGRAGAAAMNRLSADSSYPYMLLSTGVALTAFGAAAVPGGSGFLAVYLAGLLVSRHAPVYRLTVVRFHEGLSWVAQVGMFVLLGLLVFPSQLPSVAGGALAITAALMLVARPLAIWICTLPWPFRWQERLFLGWAGLRGAVPIVLATVPLAAGVERSWFLFHVVFFVVLASVAVQGTTLAPLARWLGLTAPGAAPAEPRLELAPVGRPPVGLIHVQVSEGSPAAGRSLAQVNLPPGATVTMLLRDGQVIPPRGRTVLHPGDSLYVLVQQRDVEPVVALLTGTGNGNDASGPAAASPR